jgi:hypothetical protein
MGIIIVTMPQHVHQVALQPRLALPQHHQGDLRPRTVNQVHRFQTANQVHHHRTVNQVHRFQTANQVHHHRTVNQVHRYQTANQVHPVVETAVAVAIVEVEAPGEVEVIAAEAVQEGAEAVVPEVVVEAEAVEADDNDLNFL